MNPKRGKRDTNQNNSGLNSFMIMAYSLENKDLSKVPYFTHGFVEEYIKIKSTSSGESYIGKGYKYFSEGYIGDITGI